MEIISWTLANGVLTIVLPYRDAEQLTPVWAEAENDIAFRRQARQACRCTLAFAAMELRRCLARTVPGLEVRFASRPPRSGYALILAAADPGSRADAFSLIPEGALRLRVLGEGRTGTLFGAYRFLAMQGWRWLVPGEAGEVAPEPNDRLRVPAVRVDERPGLDAGRGFDMEYASMESADLLLWAARNGLNVWAGREATLPLAHKLGMTIKRGGHIFEKLLHPDVLLPDGRTLWDAHPDWFGLPADGARRREAAQRTQFCVCRPALFEFLGEALVRRMRGEWAAADRVDVWGFDTWGQTCQCPECQAVGNASDAMLVMASRLREVLDRAEAEGCLDRHVTLILCAYEGTASLDGPSRPVPANLAADGTLVTFYPINRCYQHALDDRTCATNLHYWQALNAWTAARQAPPPGTAVNPAELRRLQHGSRGVARLAEDLRLLQYGVDVLELTVALLAYHEALRTSPADPADALWSGIEAAADRLEQYIVPIDYEWPTPGLVAKDGLQRSQLGPLVERCRAWRLRTTGSRGDIL